MPTFTKTWSSKENITLAQATTAELCAAQLWHIKAFLVGTGITGWAPPGGAWTVESSSDASTFAASDLLGASFDNSKWTRAVGLLAHTHITLKSPLALGPWYLTLDWSTANDYQAQIVLSKVAPSGGATTARPSVAALNGIAREARFTTQTFNDNQTGYKMHGKLASDGSFVITFSRNGTGSTVFTLAGFSLIGASASDAFNFHIYAGYSGGGRGSLARGVLQGGTGGGGSDSAYNWLGFAADGSAIVPTLPAHYSAASGTVLNDAISFRRSDQKQIELPIPMACTVAGQEDVRGYLDLFWAPSTLPVGCVDDTSAPTVALMGDIWQKVGARPSL